MENLHLIAGLGNPGVQYAKTRHNAGFLVVGRLAARWEAVWTAEKRFKARLARAARSGVNVLLCKPQTYMNASGEAVAPLMAFYRVPPGRFLAVIDDADLPLGEIRLRRGGSSGGHHGLESIERHLGTTAFARQRIGIGRAAGAREITGYVLGRFHPAEAAVADRVVEVACDQLVCWLTAGIDKAMNRFNGSVETFED
jgi:PTH1 family peptidyl-tRNA hydrolase